MSQSNDLPQILLDLIYDAATDGSLWISTLLRIAEMTASERGVLCAKSLDFNLVCVAKKPVHGYRSAPTEAFPQSPWTRRQDAMSTGSVALYDSTVSFERLISSGYLGDESRPIYDVVVPIAATRALTAAFRLQRTGHRGPFGNSEYRLFARLAPHISRSLLLGFRIDGYRALRRAESRVLEQFTGAIILLDDAGYVLFANTAARVMASDGGPLLLHNRTLLGASAAHGRQLDTLIRAVLGGTPTATMGVPHPADGRLMTIVVSPVSGPDVSIFAEPYMRDARVMLFVFDPATPAEIPLDWITNAYGLTLAEARVALLTARGNSVAETAARLRLSSNTVKTHLRRVFAKTGVAGQVELAGMLAAIRGLTGHRY